MESKSAKNTLKKALGILLNVIVYLFFAVCVFMLILTITAKKDSDGAMEIFGYQMRLVVSPSMEKCDQTDVSGYKIKDIPVHSMVFIETVPDDEEAAEEWYSRLEAGDVLTFRYVYGSQTTITHRIVGIARNEFTGGYIIDLEGDNKNDGDGVLTQTIDTSDTGSPNYVIGKVTAVSTVLGFLVYAVSMPVGIILIIIIPCAGIIILMVIRIINAVSGEKKQKQKEEQAKKDDEIEELKRRLAALEGTDNQPEKQDAPSTGDSNE